MKINQLKSGVILSYATQAVHIVTNILYTPIILRILGQSDYGLYQLVSSVVSNLSLLSFGFGSSYVRFFARYEAKKDTENVAKLNGMFLLIFLVLASLCILCGGVMVVNAGAIFGDGLTNAELNRSRILMALMVFNMAVNFVSMVFGSYVTAKEKFFFQRVLSLGVALSTPILTLCMLLMGFGSIGLVMISTITTLVSFLLNIYFCFNRLEMKFKFRNLKFEILKEMWIFTFYIFIGLIVDQINWSVDKFLLGRMMGTIAVAVYGIAAQFNTMYMSVSTSISSVFIPRVNMIVEKKNNSKELTDIFTKVGRVQFIILTLVLSGYVLFGREFIAIWAGDGYETSYIIGLFLMLPVTIPLIQNIGIEIQRAKNMHKSRSYVYLFIAIANIFISIPCIKIWGEVGAAIGTAISLTLGNIIFMNIYYHVRIKLDMIYFWKEIAKFIPAIAISVLVGYCIKSVLSLNNIIVFGTAIILYCLVYLCTLWFIGMNENEKQMVSRPLKAIGGKLCRK